MKEAIIKLKLTYEEKVLDIVKIEELYLYEDSQITNDFLILYNSKEGDKYYKLDMLEYFVLGKKEYNLKQERDTYKKKIESILKDLIFFKNKYKYNKDNIDYYVSIFDNIQKELKEVLKGGDESE